MLIPAHLVLGYGAYRLLYGQDDGYLPVFLLATVAADLDHLPAYWQARARSLKVSGAFWRTRLHELWGLMAASTVALAAYPFAPRATVACLFGYYLHLAIDFLSGENHPLHPFSEIVTKPVLLKDFRARCIAEAVLGGVFIFLLWKTFGR